MWHMALPHVQCQIDSKRAKKMGFFSKEGMGIMRQIQEIMYDRAERKFHSDAPKRPLSLIWTK